MFGPHLMVDCYGCDSQRLKDMGLIASFLDELPAAIDMTKIMPPYVFRYTGEVLEDWGISGVVLIAESHISIHTFPDKQYLSFDMFSCREFDTEYVTNYLTKEFGAHSYDRQIVSRGREFPRSLGRAVRITGEERERLPILPHAGEAHVVVLSGKDP